MDADEAIRAWGAAKLAERGTPVDADTVAVEFGVDHTYYSTITGCDATPEIEIRGVDSTGRTVYASLEHPSLTAVIREVVEVGAAVAQ